MEDPANVHQEDVRVLKHASSSFDLPPPPCQTERLRPMFPLIPEVVDRPRRKDPPEYDHAEYHRLVLPQSKSRLPPFHRTTQAEE